MEDPSSSLSADDSDPSPKIEQNVTGKGSQVIGTVTGGTVIGRIDITINDRIPTASLPPSNIVVQQLTHQEYRQRQVLLNKVKDFWVKGVLEQSLHAKVSIELGLQERPDLLQKPFSGVAEFAAAPGQSFAEGTSATDVFDRLGLGRTLLILGEPGSGKTIALLKLAEDAIERTEPDLRQQIPVVFNLSSWARKPQSIEQWLIQELDEKYGVHKDFRKVWVESEALMLLLDGLDEVKAEQRNACVQALNQFMQTHGTTEIVICCRIGDYQMLQEQDRLKLRSAICLQPLTATQIDRYFEQAGDRLSTLKAVLPQDAELQQLAKSPLMLSVMSLAYQDFTLEQLTLGGKTEDYRKRLFATYIGRMFQRRETTQQYSRDKTQRWLTWLAQGMTVASQTVFLIEGLQPSWLSKERQRILDRVESGCIAWLIFGLIFWIFSLLISGVLSRLNRPAIFSLISEVNDWRFYLFVVFLTSLLSVMPYGICVALLTGDIKPIESMRWSWQEVRNNFPNILGNGLRLGLIVGLTSWLFYALDFGLFIGLIYGLLHWLTSWLIFCLVGGLISGFQGTGTQQKENPNQGIFRSALNAAIIGISSSVIIGLFFELSSSSGLSSSDLYFKLSNELSSVRSVGLFSGLFFGGNAVIRHSALRFMLYRRRYAPWNYARFLDYATERLFLQKVGGGYIFVHRMLLEHFAEMSLEQKKR
jgi:NACHT domain